MTHSHGYDPYTPATLPPVVARYIEEHADPERRKVAERLTALGLL